MTRRPKSASWRSTLLVAAADLDQLTPSTVPVAGSQADEKWVTSCPRRASAAPSPGTKRSAPRRTSGQQNAWVRAMRTRGSVRPRP